jgi:hypothetical protein
MCVEDSQQTEASNYNPLNYSQTNSVDLEELATIVTNDKLHNEEEEKEHQELGVLGQFLVELLSSPESSNSEQVADDHSNESIEHQCVVSGTSPPISPLVKSKNKSRSTVD